MNGKEQRNVHHNQQTTMATVAENVDPNLSTASNNNGLSPAVKLAAAAGKKPPRSKKLRVSISPKRPTVFSSPGARRSRNRRRSSSHFGNAKKLLAAAAEDDSDSDEEEDDDDDSDIEFTLDGAAAIGGVAEKKNTIGTTSAIGSSTKATKKNKPQQRRRRRSSARFLRLSAGGNTDANADDADASDSPSKADDFTSSEHLGEIYRQAIRMNAENKINAGNSWGLKLIENMDKFMVEDGKDSNNSGEISPRNDARDTLKAARKMKSKDDKGRVNFTKASCTLDASVKIYSYRVDDVHLSSYRVLANLNRTDNKKDNAANIDGEGMGDDGGEKVVKRRTGPRGPTETLEMNTANINMSKLDSAYDIDPLFHKMSKSFDEGGAKGLLLGNLGVSQHGCQIVFDSKEDEDKRGGEPKLLDNIEEGGEEKEEDNEEEEKFDIDPEEAVVWKESEIDITNLASKLESMLASYGHRTSDSVPFVPQLESLRHDYAILEEEGFAVDEKDATGSIRGEGRKRLKLYDAPEEEEKEAERSIHVIAMERSRGSVLGMSFDTNFRLSMDMDDGDNELGGGGGGGDFGAEDFGGEGEFAPDTGSFGGDGEFAPDFGGDDGGGFDGGDDSQPGNTFVDARSYNNTKVLLDALCNGDAFYEGSSGGNSDYAFFDMKKFEKATDGNLWAGSQHWKKKPSLNKDNNKKGSEKKKVMFDDGEGEKKGRKKAAKKDRVFIDFSEAPDVNVIFEKKKTTKRTKKTKKDAYQMPQTEKDFLLPPDANVDISQLTRLFSRPNAVVRRGNGNEEPVGKTVGFYDVEDNALGFDGDDDGDFGGNDDGGFTFAYGEEDDQAGGDNDADYNVDNFDQVRKVEKIDITYATVAKKVDVRRLKKDLWTELEEKTALVEPDACPDNDDAAADEEKQDDVFEFEEGTPKGEPQFASFKQTVEKMETAQSQNDVTVSFYFICCLHLANEKGLKFDSTGLEDFMISLDDGSAPTFGTFGDGFSQTTTKLSAAANTSRSKREKKAMSYAEEGDEEEVEIEAQGE